MTGEPLQTEATPRPGAAPTSDLPVLKALTVRPPWSWVIAHGPKRVENRSWSRRWRGQLAIHAGKAWDRDGEYSRHVVQAWRAAGHTVPELRPEHPQVAVGAIVAVADLVDICMVQGGYTDCACGPWAVPFQCHWKLADVRLLAEPVPCRGALDLWTVPDEAAAAVRAQLAETAGGGSR